MSVLIAETNILFPPIRSLPRRRGDRSLHDAEVIVPSRDAEVGRRLQAEYFTCPPTTVNATVVSRIASAWAKSASSDSYPSSPS